MTPRIDPNKELIDLLDDPCCPFWILNLVPVLLKKDPVDVANAASLLSQILDRRMDSLLLQAQEEIDLVPTLVAVGFQPVVLR